MAVTAAASGARILIITTDPAPSLGDALAHRAGASPVRIPLRRGSLHAVEIDAPRALERWLGARRASLERIAVRGSWLDEDDVARLLRLSLPGIDEIAALLECVRFERSGRFDRIIVDTAPTGHTLRMLMLPGLLGRLAHLFDSMQEKHREMVAALRGNWRPDADDALIEELRRDAAGLAALLRDCNRMETVWVTLPEPMAVEETADAIAALEAQGMAVRRIIVNRMTPPPATRCRHCEARRAFERAAISALAAMAHGTALTGVSARQTEPRGVSALASIGADVAAAVPLAISRAKPARAARAFRVPAGRGAAADLRDLAHASTRLILFGGKGGVGKTTCAAAAAMELAAGAPGRRVLLLSTDPAHSVADLLGVAVSDVPRPVRGAPANLFIRELDAGRRFAAIREKYAATITAVFDRIARGSPLDASRDRAVMHDLINLAPPGIDELIGVSQVTDALASPDGPDAFDLIVMDMAPSGHARRLLETPALVQDWARTLMSILLKYQPVIGVGELGALLLKLSQQVGRLRELLRDPQRTCLIAVTRAAELPRAETVRLATQLARMHVRVRAVVVNAVGRGTCSRCRREMAAEARELTALVAAPPIRNVPLLLAPTLIPPPHGIAGIREWSRSIRTFDSAPVASVSPRKRRQN
jgi:arsenite/tail-anchored protein-transporting ATPase